MHVCVCECVRMCVSVCEGLDTEKTSDEICKHCSFSENKIRLQGKKRFTLEQLHCNDLHFTFQITPFDA